MNGLGIAEHDEKLMLHAYDNAMIYLARLAGYARMQRLKGDLDISSQVRLSALDDLLYLCLNARRFLEISGQTKCAQLANVSGVPCSLVYSEAPLHIDVHNMSVWDIINSVLHSRHVELFLSKIELEAVETNFSDFLRNLDLSRLGSEPNEMYFAVRSDKKKGFFVLYKFLEKLSADVLAPAVDQIEVNGVSVRKSDRTN